MNLMRNIVTFAVVAIASLCQAATYGPFYPGQLQSQLYQCGGAPWSINGQTATVDVEDGATEYLVASEFSISGVPNVSLAARLEICPAPQSIGCNMSDAQMHIGGIDQDAAGWPSGARIEGLTLADVTDGSFSAKIALSIDVGGIKQISVALYLDEE